MLKLKKTSIAPYHVIFDWRHALFSIKAFEHFFFNINVMKYSLILINILVFLCFIRLIEKFTIKTASIHYYSHSLIQSKCPKVVLP